MNTEEQIQILKSQLAERDELIDEVVDRNFKYLEKIDELEKIIKELHNIINTFTGKKPPKNSANSNLPPSSDIFRTDKRRSRRVKSKRKAGGQKGHKGHHLKFSDAPDQMINHLPASCLDCGSKLDEGLAQLYASRQVLDLPPPPKPIVFQHNIFAIPCKCGCLTRSVFPSHVNSPVQYGPRIRALINYCSVRQFIPFDRMVELLNDCFNISMSKGTIANTLKRSADKASGIYQQIKQQILKAEVLGSDETSLFVNGMRKVLWVWQNKTLTYLKVADSRSARHISEEFPGGFPNAVLISDQYAAQLNTPAKAHQSCFAHIDRKLIYLLEIQNSKWVKNIRALFYHAIELKKQHGYFKRKSKRTREIEQQLNHLLLKKMHYKTHPEVIKMQQSLKKHRDSLLTFLFHKDVPPDNNTSEQAIRCLKVKMKISGGFKSLQQQFAIMRPIIDTAIKNDRNIFNILIDIEKGNKVVLCNF